MNFQVRTSSGAQNSTQETGLIGIFSRFVTLGADAHLIRAVSFDTATSIPTRGEFMRKMIGRLMCMCFLAASLTAFAQSGDPMKQDSMKHDDMQHDQMNDDQMKKDEMKKDKKSSKTKKDKMKHDDMKKDDNRKHDDKMKQN
jgi:pentapeptide MXKDX repeat protein